ncbi:MAG: hypothetical protein H6839_09780 [Planctomycetes bacterium]|nr:hypothetical protein [Planctomycetota bacterium]
MSEFAESLDSLWAVQKHDRAIVRAQETIDKTNRDTAASLAKLEARQAKLAERQEELRKLHNEHKELEGELHRLDERVKQLEGQGTEAGMDAAAKQRAKIDELEMKGLDLIAAVATAEQNVEAARAEAEAYRTTHEATAAANGEVIKSAEAVIAAEYKTRAESVANVVPELLQVYEEVNTRHPGKALCHLEGEFCGGCQSELNTQLQMQIRARKEILRCRNCTRILDV